MVKEDHTINGKFEGCFYSLESGEVLYLAHRSPGDIHTAKWAWLMDESLLRKCESRGVEAVGVVMRKNGRNAYFLTKRTDFYDEAKSFKHFSTETGAQRGLPLKWFRIHPINSVETLNRIAPIRR